MKSARTVVAAAIILLALTTACHHRRPKGAAAETKVVPVSTLYAKGMEYLKKKRPATARRYFDQVLMREDAGEYKDKAQIAEADSYTTEHTLEAYSEAISRYQSFLAFHPTHPEAPYCQYKIGSCYFEEIETPDRDVTPARDAREAFKSLIENYPNCSYVAEAKQKIKDIDNVLAAHEIKIGDWYLKVGHPKGAIGRYRYTIEHYPTYWNMPLVYYRLGEALHRDGQDKEAVLYFKRITQEVPGTVLAKDSHKYMSKIEKHEARTSKRDKKIFEEPLVKSTRKKTHWWQFWKW